MSLKPLIPPNLYNSSSGGSGSGDVTGPASATDGNLAVFDGTTGKKIKDGGAVPSGSSPQLPAWTYTAGTIGDGLFTTDNSSANLTTAIVLSGSVIGPLSNLDVGQNSYLILTGPTGACSLFLIVSRGGGGEFNVVFVSGTQNWSGTYTVSFPSGVLTALENGVTSTTQEANDNSTKVSTTAYADNAVALLQETLGIQLVADTGFSAPADAGTKSVVLADFPGASFLSTDAGSFNLLYPETAAALQALVGNSVGGSLGDAIHMLQAILTSLLAQKLPQV